MVSFWPGAVSVSNGELVASDGTEHKIIFPSATPLEEFMVSVDINTAVSNVSCGLYVFANNAGPDTNIIDALSIYIGQEGSNYTPAIYQFASDHGYDGCLAVGETFTTSNQYLNLKVVVKDMNLYAFVNGSDAPCMTCKLSRKMSGNVGLRSYYSQSRFDNFTIQSPQYKVKPSAIDGIETDPGQSARDIYDLSGRKVAQPSATGIYIINGKKVLVRI